MISVVGNGNGDNSSNPGQGCIHFSIALIPLGKGMHPALLPPTMVK